MASEQITNPVSGPASTLPPVVQAWLTRLGTSGKLLALGGAVGVIAVFLPLLSVSMQMSAGAAHTIGSKGGVTLWGFGMSQSVAVIRDWRGVICLLGYLGALALAYVLYQPMSLRQAALNWAGAGVGALVTLLAFWLLVAAWSGSSSASGFGASLQVSVGFGAILNFLAAGVVAAGGFLKAREEKLI